MDGGSPDAVTQVARSRARWLLGAGLAGGVLAAALGTVTDLSAPMRPADTVARVNERSITRSEWQRAVAAVESERRTPLSAGDRRRILERLVDEELLVQHGLALGLVERDRRLRGQLVSEVMAAAAAMAPPPDAAAMRAYYERHRDYFSTPARVRVAALRISADAPGAEARAASAVRRLRAGEQMASVTADLGRPFMPPVPDTLLPPAKLQAYLGPTLTGAALGLGPGATSEPLPAGDGFVVLRVLEKTAATVAPFEDMQDAVREAMRRDADEAAVRGLLGQLRADGDVAVDAAGP